MKSETRKADHPAVIRARKKYCTRGACAAKTQRGIIRYALAHHHTPFPHDLDSTSLRAGKYAPHYFSHRVRPALTQDERDARRARNDKKFLRRWT
ncbi:MAG: hypothetical protein WC373_04800 [Smithella sp.]